MIKITCLHDGNLGGCCWPRLGDLLRPYGDHVWKMRKYFEKKWIGDSNN